MTKTGFQSLKLKPFLAKALEKTGFTELTPIQKEAIPVALQGEDLIGQAQTGTGKTIAFGIPIVELVLPVHGVQAL
ncbi:MAG: DEAD/DEAH box helicase, partial [Candidatus Micrarchaeota archaeon]